MKLCPPSLSSRLVLTFAVALPLAAAVSSAGAHDHAHPAKASQRAPSLTAKDIAPGKPPATKLPPLPEGVTELKFSDFFVKPVGARGLELTDKLRGLDGRRVRMLGYMVQQEEPPPGMFLFSPVPAQVHEHDNGLADDLPPSTVRVLVPTCPERPVPFTPGLMLLTGTLSVGNRAEADHRVSIARLALDPPAREEPSTRQGRKLSAPPGKGAERLVSITSRK
jgi:hypothetical protein